LQVLLDGGTHGLGVLRKLVGGRQHRMGFLTGLLRRLAHANDIAGDLAGAGSGLVDVAGNLVRRAPKLRTGCPETT
jgi:hypothetical protein